jgi:hypothetical protein
MVTDYLSFYGGIIVIGLEAKESFLHLEPIIQMR